MLLMLVAFRWPDYNVQQVVSFDCNDDDNVNVIKILLLRGKQEKIVYNFKKCQLLQVCACVNTYYWGQHKNTHLRSLNYYICCVQKNTSGSRRFWTKCQGILKWFEWPCSSSAFCFLIFDKQKMLLNTLKFSQAGRQASCSPAVNYINTTFTKLKDPSQEAILWNSIIMVKNI